MNHTLCGLCFLSSWYAFTMFFDSLLFSLPLAVIYSLIVFNFYQLLLCTLTKNTLPHTKTTTTTVASVCRIVFVLLIAGFVSKPIEVLLFNRWLQPYVTTYRSHLYEGHQQHLDAYYHHEEQRLLSDLTDQKQSGVYHQPTANRLAELSKKKIASMGNMSALIDKSPFFVYRLSILNQAVPQSWLVTFSMMALFMLPAIIKYLLPSSGEYYTRKTQIERELIESAYRQFKSEYTYILSVRYKLDTEWIDHYVDPPYNTKRVIRRVNTASEQDLLAHIYRRGV